MLPIVAVESGNFRLFKELAQKGHKHSSRAFYAACGYGHLKIAKWLLSKHSSIDVHLDNDGAFRMACARGHLKVVKWLLSVKPSIDIHSHNDDAFCAACANGHLKVAKWLVSVHPLIVNRAYAFGDGPEQIKVAKWQQRKYLIVPCRGLKSFNLRRAVQLISFFN
jgi:ankyrin repeat protein